MPRPDDQFRVALTASSYDAWATLTAHVTLAVGDAWHWYYADLTGAHVTTHLPETRPLATHVWGWSRQARIRIRLDQDDVHLTESRLARDGEHSASEVSPSAWSTADNAVRISDSLGDLLTGCDVSTWNVDVPGGVLQFHALQRGGAQR